MLAARFGGDRKVVLEDVERPEPGEDEVLVKVDTCALCGTDRRAWLAGSEQIPGHETSGTIAALGGGVPETIAEGSRGVVYLVASCGGCAACAIGAPNTCMRKRATYGFSAPGGFAEYVAVRADCFLPVDEAIPLDAATSLLDLFGTTTHAFIRAGRAAIGSVAVIGCGPIGLGAIAVARRQRVPVILGMDVSAFRLDLATRLGATPLDVGRGDAAAGARRVSPDGFDVVIEAAGTASSQRTAIDVCAPGGVVVTVAHSERPIELWTSSDLISVERAIVGSEYFRPTEFAAVHDALRTGELDPAPILTHAFPLERIADACKTFFEGDSGKVLVRP
jgi:threonine dehydrogenase-like Zn-dependent dehydrogenase